MKPRYAVVVFLFFAISSALSGMKSYQDTRDVIDADLQQALLVTLAAQDHCVITPDTIRNYRASLSIGELRDTAYLAYTLQGEIQAKCSTAAVFRLSDQRLSAPFSNSQYLSVQTFNLYDNMNVCLGNFLGKENQAYLGSTTLSRLPVMTLRHEVNRITDGLGRKTDFTYDYLVPNPNHVTENDFYRLYATPITRGQSIRCLAIPIRALKTITKQKKRLVIEPL